ncbi:isoleucine--tRNA ligase [Candidatus Saccharibacteria bacterium]|nr:isoleucine--tRNA ligase [Candidatus Saccharibacteria bacterium]
MKYEAGKRRRALEYEKAISDWWKKNKFFEKSVANRNAKDSYVFYDGPPFITGMPHHGTLLSSIIKDAVPRYWTMQGKHVERRWGWDCHGLPAENYVEKQLGITDRREIGNKISLESYILKARDSMVANSETWRSTVDRIGRWVDFDNAYRTMNKDFMESVWWAFKTLYEKGYIYEGAKVLMYDTKFATPVSKAEVTMDNDAYQTVTDPSAYVKFEIAEGEMQGAYFMAWTTTPWTLLGNAALAVNPDLEYALYQDATDSHKRKFIVLKGKQWEGWQEIKSFSGRELIGLRYNPHFLNSDRKCNLVDWQDFAKNYYETNTENIYKVWGANFVGNEEGTGIVHIAPAYGEDDFELGRQNQIPLIDVLDNNGFYLEGAEKGLLAAGVRPDDSGKIHAWDMNKIIAKCLEQAKIIEKIEYIKHEYPFNPRSKQRIMYRAIPSWFFDVQNLKPELIKNNESINWFPEHFKEGRFRKNIEAAPDWNLSRDRFWATAMPVWKGDKGTIKVVGSYQELKELSGKELEDYHRPWVDEVEFDIDGEHFKRVDKVLDCWFESGSMPFAQMHYPFENKDKFENNYPADFIVEYVGQIRAWFYYVHVVNTALFGKNAYKNVIVTGTLAGNDGRKMSKSLGNFTDPNELMDKFSADSLRFLLLSSPVAAGEDFALLDKDVSDVARKLSMVWNVYDFFTTYAEVDGFDSEKHWEPKDSSIELLENPLDRWIISRLHELKSEIITGMEVYNIPKALAGVLPFLDDLSNWFVRRSRRRFWKSEDDTDKNEAYWTLYTVLVEFAIMMAPFTPFLSEELYQKMTGAGSSVHLLDYPSDITTDKTALELMNRTREIITDGLMMRMQKSDTETQVKIRQPLSVFTYGGNKLPEFYEQIIKDELNVKTIKHGKENKLDKTITKELEEEGFVRELIRAVQAARKKAGLQVDDRIKLSVTLEIPNKFRKLLMTETLTTDLSNGNYEYDEIVTINGKQGTISIEKA